MVRNGKAKVYLETTIPSYLAARPSRDLITAGHQQLTHLWWNRWRYEFDFFVSPLVWAEAQRGDGDAAKRRSAILAEVPSLPVTANAEGLAELLVSQGGIPHWSAADAGHIALAAAHALDFLVTWNFRTSTTRPRLPLYGRYAKTPAIAAPSYAHQKN